MSVYMYMYVCACDRERGGEREREREGVCVHLEGFHDRLQTGYPPGRSIFTFSSPLYVLYSYM